MTELWKTLTAMALFFIAAQGAVLWAMKTLLDNAMKAHAERLQGYEAQQDERFRSLSDALRSQAKRTDTVATDQMRLREELAKEYVRREDWIRFGVTITAKLDALWAALDALKERLYDRST